MIDRMPVSMDMMNLYIRYWMFVKVRLAAYHTGEKFLMAIRMADSRCWAEGPSCCSLEAIRRRARYRAKTRTFKF